MRARGAQRLHGATLATLVASALVAGCGGPAYEVRGARATAPGTLLSAEIKRVESWRSGDLNAPVVVELELRNGDPTRAHTTAPPHLVARSVMGGPYFELALTRIGADSPEVAVPAGATRTLRLEFEPRAEAPPGPYRLALVEQVDGSPPFEVLLADPPGGPRWQATRAAVAAYFKTGWAFVGGRDGIVVMEPVGVSLRFSFGRFVLGVDERYTFLFRTTTAGAGNSFGLSGLASLAWQPWSWHLAPYLEGGGYGGFGESPRAPDESRIVGSPRLSAGVLWFLGSRIGSETRVPIDRPLSPQRAGGLRVAYTRWFRTGQKDGSDGVEIALELGFAR